ncbi:MAG TPA: protein kinase [Pyrinomonadaceae bacterium]|nr:protein kinase [Pyrinomonadaceae bacterium]
MNSERWQKIQEIFETAIEIENPAYVSSYLENACAGDDELKNEIEKLLKQDAEAESLMNRPLIEESGFHLLVDFEEENDQLIGKKIGNYQITKEIGHGGMGSVYLAERVDGEFEQKVAIKLIKRGMDTRFILRRFRQERQILASLEHPYIALLLNGGTTEDNLPYFVMEFIEGEPFFQFCDNQNLSLRSRLELFQEVCEAVDYAHQKKVIHRDLKPSNILIKRDGTPKLLDFGIAKVFDSNLDYTTVDPTATAMRMMTPEYASPEQIKGETVTPASDIYSLGVLLYELLTKNRPYHFKNKAPHEVARVICEEKPIPILDFGLGILDLNVVNLEKILFKTLRKNPLERYQTVKEFNQDITNYLAGKPISTPVYLVQTKVFDKKNSPKSIAVLPLRIFNLTADESLPDEFLSIGLADAMITRLSGVHSLAVRPTSAVLKYSDKNANLLEAGRELAVDYVLEGHLKRAGSKIRVSLKLLDIEKGISIWANQFDEIFTDALDLEDSLTGKVVEAILPELTQTERLKVKKRGTDNPEAYEFYLRGRFYRNQVTPEGSIKANENFKRAIELDPNYALAYAAMADCYFSIGAFGVGDRRECWDLGRKAAEKAIELDSELAEAYAILGFIYLGADFNSKQSLKLIEHAIELNPNYASGHMFYSISLIWEGQFEKAIAEAEKVIELDPQTPFNQQHLAWILYHARRYDEALTKCREVVKTFPDFAHGRSTAAWILTYAGEYEEAIENAEKAVELSSSAPYTVGGLAAIYAIAGKTEQAREILKKAENLPVESVSHYPLAIAYAYLGEKDLALQLLEKAIFDRNVWIVWFKADSLFDILRDDPRFADLLRLVNFPSEPIKKETSNHQKEKTIAILPFQIIGITQEDSTDERFLGIGLADTLITRLSNIRQFNVRPTSSVLRYENRAEEPFSIGKELAADYVLDGSLRRIGQIMRVTVQLLNISEQTILWANQFVEEFTDAMGLEEKISEQVVEAIIPQLTGEEKKRLTRRGTANPQAHECYLRGRYFWNQFTGESLEKAIKEFETAIKLDPNYALPYVGVADFYNWISIVGVLPSGECLLKAKESAQRALELDDSLGEAFVALFFPTLCYDLNWKEAERLALRAIELNPNYSYAYECYSYVLTTVGRFEEGIKAVKRAEELEPLSPRAILMTSWTYYQTRHFAEALAKAESTLDLDKNFPQGYMHYGNSLQHLGRAEESVIALTKCISLMPEAPIPSYILCHALVAANRTEDARMFLDELKKTATKRYIKPYFMAMSHVTLGEFDAAFEWFEKGLEERDQWFVWLGTDPKLDALRKDSRFLELFKKTNNPWAESFG